VYVVVVCGNVVVVVLVVMVMVVVAVLHVVCGGAE
jgi:hypothetical protein